MEAFGPLPIVAPLRTTAADLKTTAFAQFRS